MFASCSLQYYYNQIKRLRKEKDQEEEMGADVFGTWVHKVLELVDKEVLADYAGDYDEAGLQERIPGNLDYFLEKAMSDIQKSEGNFDKRGEPFFLVTNIENDADEISTSSGFIYNKNSNVELTFGIKKYYLFPYKTVSWANDKNDDADIQNNVN